MEICLLPCYRFLWNSNDNSASRIIEPNIVENAVSRIGMILRGIGDPLLMVHMQCYLLGSGAASVITPLGGRCARALLQDFFLVYTESATAKNAKMQKCKNILTNLCDHRTAVWLS